MGRRLVGGLSEPELATRIENALVLGAIGGSRGSGVEGIAVSERRPEQLGGTYTDDTILTIATASAIANAGSVDPEAIAERFVVEFIAGIPGLGSSTLGALQALRSGQHWALAGIGGDRAAGNGAAMRIAPVAPVLDPNENDARRTIRDIARITHHNDEASTGAIALAIGIRIALRGHTSASRALAEIATALPDSQVRDGVIAAAALGRASVASAAAVLGSYGFVAESVPLALYIGLLRWNSPIEAIDTTALGRRRRRHRRLDGRSATRRKRTPARSR